MNSQEPTKLQQVSHSELTDCLGTNYRRATLDFTRVENETVRNQCVLNCILIMAYGGGAWFSPKLGRYPSRQDLAVITEIDDVMI